jgi:hypothetical protein
VWVFGYLQLKEVNIVELLHYQNRRLCRVPEALDKALKTLGKVFAECRTRQSLCRVSHSAQRARHTVHRQSLLYRVLFLGHLPGSTRQRKAAVTTPGDGDNVFAECHKWHSAKKLPLPSVCRPALDKESVSEVSMSGSLPSALYGTRQSMLLCRVPEPLHSAKNLYRCPGLGSLPSAMVLTLSKVPLCRVSH